VGDVRNTVEMKLVKRALVFFGKAAAMVAAGRLVNTVIDGVKEGYERERRKRDGKQVRS
jgi:hypothetical protein